MAALNRRLILKAQLALLLGYMRLRRLRNKQSESTGSGYEEYINREDSLGNFTHYSTSSSCTTESILQVDYAP